MGMDPASMAFGIANAGAQVAGSVMSFIEAGKQRKLMAEAKLDAEKSMNAARNALDINYFDVLSVNKEPYEREREALVSQGAQSIQAAQEGERGVAATAGRIQMAQNEAQAGIRDAMNKDMQDLSKLSAEEESRLRDEKVGIDLAEAEGAQQAAADAQKAAAQYKQQAIQGISNMFGDVAKQAPLYAKKKDPTTE